MFHRGNHKAFLLALISALNWRIVDVLNGHEKKCLFGTERLRIHCLLSLKFHFVISPRNGRSKQWHDPIGTHYDGSKSSCQQ